MVGEPLSGRTNVNVLLSLMAEVLLAEAPLRLDARSHRSWQRYLNCGLLTGKDFHAAVIAAIGNGLEFIDAEDLLCPAGDIGKSCPIRAAVRDLMRDDQMMLGIDCDLYIVADYTRAAPAGRRRATVVIAQRHLLIR